MLAKFSRFAITGAVTGALLLIPAAAMAGTGTGQDFGQHVRTCAQTMGGFSGTMNPGVMHRGFAGYPGGSCDSTGGM